MTDLHQAAATESAVAENDGDDTLSYDEDSELLLLNIDMYIEATLMIAKKRKTRRADWLNEVISKTLGKVRGTLHAHFLAQGHRPSAYGDRLWTDFLKDELSLPAEKIFDSTSLSDTTVAAVHSDLLRSRADIMIAFAADVLDRAEPETASKVLRACQTLLKQEAELKQFARGAEMV